MPLELIQPGRFEHPSVVGQAIVDTGSDCTLVPIPWLIQVNAQISDRKIYSSSQALPPNIIREIKSRHNQSGRIECRSK
jgi:hypothetical protein